MLTLGSYLLLWVIVAGLASNVCLGQSERTVQSKTAIQWKTGQLVELEQQLSVESIQGAIRKELEAQKDWLNHWNPGNMAREPAEDSSLPKIRTEPILKSDLATSLRKRLSVKGRGEDESDHQVLQQALTGNPHDIALQQLNLHWLDDPTRRKTYLKQIDAAGTGLLKSLKEHPTQDATIQMATEFTLYRLGRALVYRELPDVVEHTPIEDPGKLNLRIQAAYNDLIAASGKGRPEFILLEIRMLRREKRFGTALALVESYGATIMRQWYLKKRRDLLKELGWEAPYSEAAKLYASEFPDEVARETNSR